MCHTLSPLADPADTDTLAQHCDQSPPEQAVAIAKQFTKDHPRQPFGWTMLAHDRSLRQHIRETQREQMRASELCNGESLARALELSFEQMFARWQSC